LGQAHAGLGEALMRLGQFSAAQKSLRRFLMLLPANSPMRLSVSRRVEHCQQWIDIDGKLKAFLAGKGAPGDASSLLQMAVLARESFNQLYPTSARLYRDALARQPRLADAHRYNAACVAILAATGKGKDAKKIDPSARLVWRKQALEWLQAELATLSKKLKGEVPGQAAQARQALEHWLRDPDLAGVRDLNQLAGLSAEECEAWLRFWVEVARTLREPTQTTQQ
jgi:hypothetical protein